MRSKVVDFLDELGVNPDNVHMDNLCDSFTSEMQKGLKGEPSSLAMIAAYIGPDATIVPGEKVIVIDAGGTNLRTCLVTFDTLLKPIITHFKKTSMPGIAKEVSKKEFFSIFADQIEDIIDLSDKIGFCFSYAATITSDHDGTPIAFSKEIKAPEVIGVKVGASLLDELASRGFSVAHKKVAVVNDTVATLLAGLAEGATKHYDSYVGFILGTGTNTAYFEQTQYITKIPHLAPGSMVINVESGNFAGPRGKADELFCNTTKNPAIYHFEKMISGAYLGAFASFLIHKAMDQHLFSQDFCTRFIKEGDVNTTEMSHYLEMPFNLDYKLVRCVENNEEDALTLYTIIDTVIQRAGKQTAANLASTILKSGAGLDPRRPVCINADGTTFYKTAHLEKYTHFYLEQFLRQKHHRSFDFVCIDNSPTIGAAIAALSL